jgi:hypothetical protein
LILRPENLDLTPTLSAPSLFFTIIYFGAAFTMSTSAAGDPASAAPEKPRIRISTSKSFAKPTPVRQSHDFHPHEISPTPLRAHDRKCTAPSLNSKNTALQEELSPRVLSGLRQGDLEFPINEECE